MLGEGRNLLSSSNHFLQVDAICPKTRKRLIKRYEAKRFFSSIHSDGKIQIIQPDAILSLVLVSWPLTTSGYRYLSHILVPAFSLTVHKWP